jgi:hypothetical protein
LPKSIAWILGDQLLEAFLNPFASTLVGITLRSWTLQSAGSRSPSYAAIPFGRDFRQLTSWIDPRLFKALPGFGQLTGNEQRTPRLIKASVFLSRLFVSAVSPTHSNVERPDGYPSRAQAGNGFSFF